MAGVFGTAGSDLYYGTELNDIYSGDWGHDTIYGGAGDDSLYGNQHNDNINGGDGADEIFGGQGDDVINGYGYWLTSGGEIVRESYGSEKFGNSLYGNMGNDTVVGSAGNDTIFGGQGDDVLNVSRIDYSLESKGYDIVYGNLGDDTIGFCFAAHGGAGNDQIQGVYAYGGDGDDRVYGTYLTGGAGNDVFTAAYINYYGTQIVNDFENGEKISFWGGFFISGNRGDYVQVRDEGANAIISIDKDGAGALGYTDLVTLIGRAGINKADIVFEFLY